jgi:hypothetical protein
MVFIDQILLMMKIKRFFLAIDVLEYKIFKNLYIKDELIDNLICILLVKFFINSRSNILVMK